MRAYYISHKRLSAPSTPASGRTGVTDKRIKPRQRLRYRDMIWAFHSESQELLLSQSIAACGGKMTWSDARSLGVFLWLRTTESLVSIRLFQWVVANRPLSESAHGSRRTEPVHDWGHA